MSASFSRRFLLQPNRADAFTDTDIDAWFTSRHTVAPTLITARSFNAPLLRSTVWIAACNRGQQPSNVGRMSSLSFSRAFQNARYFTGFTAFSEVPDSSALLVEILLRRVQRGATEVPRRGSP